MGVLAVYLIMIIALVPSSASGLTWLAGAAAATVVMWRRGYSLANSAWPSSTSGSRALATAPAELPSTRAISYGSGWCRGGRRDGRGRGRGAGRGACRRRCGRGGWWRFWLGGGLGRCCRGRRLVPAWRW
jgi:hypothetical protein